MFQTYFEVFYSLYYSGGELMIIEDPLVSANGYQLLLLATSYLVGNRRKFNVSDII